MTPPAHDADMWRTRPPLRRWRKRRGLPSTRASTAGRVYRHGWQGTSPATASGRVDAHDRPATRGRGCCRGVNAHGEGGACLPRRATRRRLARPPRQLWLSLTLLALIACAPQPVTITPDPLRDIAPIPAQVDPHLSTLAERWATGSTSGEAPEGAVLRQVLVDNPQAPLRLTYVTSQLDVATVVSPRWYRPHAYVARYRLTVRVESPATGAWQAWLQGMGEGRSLARPDGATNEAISQAVRAFCRQLGAVRDALIGDPHAQPESVHTHRPRVPSGPAPASPPGPSHQWAQGPRHPALPRLRLPG